MKIVSGLGSLDEYIPFAEAGADEFFCGYVPFTWSKKYGTMQPLNRREVMNYTVLPVKNHAANIKFCDLC